MIAFWMSVLGGIGAVVRFVSDGLIRTALGRNFPWATMIINITGSFILGLLTGIVVYKHGNGNLRLIFGTGFCGGFTTFSTASFEAVRLFEEKRLKALSIQVGGNLFLALAAAAAGLLLTY